MYAAIEVQRCVPYMVDRRLMVFKYLLFKMPVAFDCDYDYHYDDDYENDDDYDNNDDDCYYLYWAP